jgi:hypothetical protein
MLDISRNLLFEAMTLSVVVTAFALLQRKFRNGYGDAP